MQSISSIHLVFIRRYRVKGKTMTDTSTKGSSPKLQQLKIDRQAPQFQKKRNWTLIIAPVLIVVVLAAVALKPRKLEVQTSSVVTSYPSQQYAQLTASGYVVAQRRAAVASKATGRLIWLNVREGSRVKQGEIIAKLDASDVQAAMAAVQASIKQAEASVAQSNIELVNAEADLKRAQGLQAQRIYFTASDGCSTKAGERCQSGDRHRASESLSPNHK